MRKIFALAAAITLLAAPCGASAQAYPVKPVRVVVPYPPGGVDLTVRILMPSIERTLGQAWVIDYRPGATGLIGQEHVARSTADGYTLIATASTSWVNAPSLRKLPPYDPVRDFTPISMLIETLATIVSHASFPANNMRELIDYARRNPGKVSYATGGIGSGQHLDGEAITRLARIDYTHVPYQGFGPMMQALLGAQISTGFMTYGIARQNVGAGKLKILAIPNTSPESKALAPPGAQFVSEALPGFESMPGWVGVGGPAGMPRPVVMRLNDAIVKAMSEPAVAKILEQDKVINRAGPPEDFERLLRNDVARVRISVQEARIPLE